MQAGFSPTAQCPKEWVGFQQASSCLSACGLRNVLGVPIQHHVSGTILSSLGINKVLPQCENETDTFPLELLKSYSLESF